MSKYKYLFDNYEEAMASPDTIVLYTELACEIGSTAAMIFSTMDWHGTPNLDKFSGILSEGTIKKHLLKLEKLGLLSKHRYPSEQIIGILKSKGRDGVGQHICEWCGIKTFILHKHHYPISKLDGGKDMVKICGTCHYEFHHLKKKSWSLEISGGPCGELTPETESGPDNPARSRGNG